MGKIYKCSSCGVVAREEGHLCKPTAVEGKYDYCGEDFESRPGAECASMKKRERYECGTCGRPAEKPDLVCRPVKTR